MKNLCGTCKKKAPGKAEDITFAFRGLTFTVFKDAATCADCIRKEYIERFELEGVDLVQAVKGKPKVNWDIFVQAFKHDDADHFCLILMDIGLLSSDPTGNWEIITDGPIGLNPRVHILYLYFTRQEDAVAFARLKYGNTQYSWEIRRYSDVLQKSDVMKGKEPAPSK